MQVPLPKLNVNPRKNQNKRFCSERTLKLACIELLGSKNMYIYVLKYVLLLSLISNVCHLKKLKKMSLSSLESRGLCFLYHPHFHHYRCATYCNTDTFVSAYGAVTVFLNATTKSQFLSYTLMCMGRIHSSKTKSCAWECIKLSQHPP